MSTEHTNSKTTPPDFTEQARQLVDELKLIPNVEIPDASQGLAEKVAADLIAAFAAEAATQGQAASDALREALRDAAIEAHVGFNHPRQWADCDLAVCSERKGLIGDCNE